MLILNQASCMHTCRPTTKKRGALACMNEEDTSGVSVVAIVVDTRRLDHELRSDEFTVEE